MCNDRFSSGATNRVANGAAGGAANGAAVGLHIRLPDTSANYRKLNLAAP